MQLLTSYEYPLISIQQNKQQEEQLEDDDEDGVFGIEDEEFEQVVKEFGRYCTFIQSLYSTQDFLPHVMKVVDDG